MIIRTSTGIQLYQITNMSEPVYVEGIPYSLQQKCNIPKNIAVKYYKGTPCIYYNTGEIDTSRVSKVIKIINGYAKTHNQVRFR